MKILIIIPAYNEEDSIKEVIFDVKSFEPEADILVIDDGSLDKTSEAAKGISRVISLRFNLGIGGAVQTGFKYAKENNYDLVVRVDGDGQHQAKTIADIKRPVLEGEADVVIGSRFLGFERPKTVLTRKIGQKITSLFVSPLIRQMITDVTSGFRCYNKEAINLLAEYYPSDYPEPEEIIFLKKNGFKIKEVGVSMKSREKGISSLNNIRSVYYAIKVSLSIFISILRNPLIKK